MVIFIRGRFTEEHVSYSARRPTIHHTLMIGLAFLQYYPTFAPARMFFFASGRGGTEPNPVPWVKKCWWVFCVYIFPNFNIVILVKSHSAVPPTLAKTIAEQTLVGARSQSPLYRRPAPWSLSVSKPVRFFCLGGLCFFFKSMSCGLCDTTPANLEIFHDFASMLSLFALFRILDVQKETGLSLPRWVRLPQRLPLQLEENPHRPEAISKQQGAQKYR